MGSVRRNTVVPTHLLQRHGAVTSIDVDYVDVLEALAVEIAHQTVAAVVVGDSVLSFGRHRYVAHIVVTEAHETICADVVHGQVVKVLIPVFLHLLHRLQPIVTPVPDDKIGFLGLGLITAGVARFGTTPTLVRFVIALLHALFGLLGHLGLDDAEHQA